ncbi:protein-disulfide reductase DsbD family protein [Vibrio agarivorans]|uniref:protein-disulfide reductase DsbD family protein n=1 Tax=Vibrio agarivorans TaxID=153622 RepID=UPI002231639D|nr:protein-disulfide reductase DsbD domain-containing protein [Vibrio agarivorans]
MQKFIWRAYCAATLMLMALSLSVHAQIAGTEWMTHPDHPPVQVKMTLTGDVNTVEKTVLGFIDVRLDDDWKTYWREPGEGGVAPSLNWAQQSENITNIDWYWPYPEQFSLFGIRTIGYQGDTTFPVHIQLSDLNETVRFRSILTLPTCTTICVLTDYPIDFEFEPSELVRSESSAHHYAKAMSLVPTAGNDAATVSAIWDQQQQRLKVEIEKDRLWQSPEVLPFTLSSEFEELLFKPLTESHLAEVYSVVYDVSSWMGEVDLANELVYFHIKDGDQLLELDVEPVVGAVRVDSTLLQGASLLTVFAWGLIGGLILNIMPCVLPVLGMKLSSITSAQGVARQQIRTQFLFTSAGILASFWLIASVLSILKLSGHAIGWGMQFQSIWFLLLMMSVTMLFAFNMLGLVTISLPSSLSSWAAQKGDSSHLGHFVQGMFATLLATPCSAPFLTTAIAYAFGADIPTMFVIFTSLALGMSMPWLLIASFPRMVSYMPKPGRWMVWFKLALGVMMMVTSLWLLSLLRHHIPVFWVAVVALATFVWVLARVKTLYGDKWLLGLGGGGIALFAGAMLVGSVTADHWVTPLPPEPDWVPLSQSTIEQSVKQGKTVFVDVSADWCITCKSNKIGVLLQDPVYSHLQSADVVPMLGDWTRAHPDVTDYLREHQRYGVPFNMVYGPGAPQGIPLPVLLTDEAVLAALKQARGES